jgi:hypothetical protein
MNDEDERRCRGIRMRAERRVGQLLRETASAGEGRNASEGRPTEASSDTRLSDWGVSWDQSSRSQRVASLSDDHNGAPQALVGCHENGASTSDLIEMTKIKECGGRVEVPATPVPGAARCLWCEPQRMERGLVRMLFRVMRGRCLYFREGSGRANRPRPNGPQRPA